MISNMKFNRKLSEQFWRIWCFPIQSDRSCSWMPERRFKDGRRVTGLVLKRLCHDYRLSRMPLQRLLTGSGKWDHIIPILSSLHCLPIRYRIDFIFQICCSRTLHQDLLGPLTRISWLFVGRDATFGMRLWNSLPLHRITDSTLVSFNTQDGC